MIKLPKVELFARRRIELRHLAALWSAFLGFSTLLAIGALVFVSVTAYKASALITSSVNSMDAGARLQIALLDFNQQSLLWSLTQKRGYLVAAEQNQNQVANALELARRLSGARHVEAMGELELVDRLQTAVNDYIDAVHEARQRAEPPLVAYVKLHSLFEGADALASQYVVLHRYALDRELHRVAHLAAAAAPVVIGAGLALALSVLLVVLGMRRQIAFPLGQLEKGIRDFSQGRLGTRIEPRGPEELRSISRAANEMAQGLQDRFENELRFVASVAHDLRAPLSAMRLAATLSPEAIAAPARCKKSLDTINRQIDRLSRMVGDLLDATRIRAGRWEMRIESLDLRRVVHDVVELLAPGAPRHPIAFVEPSGPVQIAGDRLRLEQVVTNLLTNAIKYSPLGGEVRLDLAVADREVVLSVSDQGMGIAGEDLPHIFEPFYRAHRMPGEIRIPGVGLGLSVAKLIVEKHGGRIEAQSQLGTGSVFRVHLPRAMPRATLSQPGQEAPVSPPPATPAP